ncbi:MAG: rhomboid family intramembrane serine protease [Candidatus Nanoarchaeia archaeon]
MRRFLFSSYTAWLILINIIIFVITLILTSIFGQGFLELIAIKPVSIFAGRNLWTIFTSIFMHAGVGHLLANMISLFFIGSFVEKLIGRRRYLIFFLIAGIFASIFYASLSMLFGQTDLGARLVGSPEGLALGASGAIFGLLGLLALLTPKNKVYLIAGPLIAIIIGSLISSIFPTQEITSIINLLVTFYFIFSIFAIFSFNPSMRKFALPLEMPFWILPIIAIVPLVIIGLFIPLPIGNSAHFGGLLAGLIYALYLKRKYPRKTARISRYFSQ